jgi:hypothetical protein
MNKKKLISIGIVVLTLVVVIVIAATVGSNDSGNILNDDTNVNDVNGDGTGSDVLPNGVTPSVDEIILLGYSAEVTEKSLKVYKDNVFVQELVYPTEKDAKFDLAFATQHLSFLDMNFDGKEDICLAVSSNQDGFNYYCWLYDSSKDEFVFNKSLSDLKSISVDSENKQIVSKEKNKKGETVYSIYEWKKDRLVKLETKDSAPDSVKDSELGSTTSNSASRPSTNNGGSQGGSTKPNGSSGVLVPGGNKPSGSGGVVLATENPNDIWY